MKSYLVLGFLLIVPLYGLSKATEELVKSMVPYGEISHKQGKDFSVRTKAGTRVIIEFDRQGELDEASGLNLGKGDIFEPGNGYLSLNSAAQLMAKLGHSFSGSWRFEKDARHGWVYELERVQDDETIDFVVDAKKGELLPMK